MAVNMKIVSEYTAPPGLENNWNDLNRPHARRRNLMSPHVVVACDCTLMRYHLNKFLVAYLRGDMSASLVWSGFPGAMSTDAYPADIAIWCGDPQDRPAHMAGTKLIWLGCLSYLPYIGRRARGRIPAPEKEGDLDHAPLLQHARWHGWSSFKAWNSIVGQRKDGVVYTDSFELIRELILGGAGIAPLPATSHRFNAELVPLAGLLQDELLADVWLAVDDASRNVRTVKNLSWMISRFFSEKRDGQFLVY